MVKRIFCLTALLAALIASGYQSAWAQSHSYTQKPVYPTIQQYGPFTTGVKGNTKDPSACAHNACLFYGGNFLDNVNFPPFLPNGLSNENDLIVGGTPYGAATWVPFTVPNNYWWFVTGLFTNNQSMYGALDCGEWNPCAFYSISYGVSAANPGTVIDSNVVYATSTPTGRSAFGLSEFTTEVTGLYDWLGPGEYWLAVVPYCVNPNNESCFDRDFLSDVEVINGTAAGSRGTEPIDSAYFDGFFGMYMFYPTYGPMGACGGMGCDAFSAGVLGQKYYGGAKK
jgi:hypothetical protein